MYLFSYLTKSVVQSHQRRHLAALVSVCIAAKYSEEDKEPHMNALLKSSSLPFDKDCMKRFEMKFLASIEWKLCFVTPHVIGNAILEALSIPLSAGFKAEIMEQAEEKYRETLLYYNHEFPMSVIVGSAISIVFNEAVNQPIWDVAIARLLKVKQRSLRDCKEFIANKPKK